MFYVCIITSACSAFNAVVNAKLGHTSAAIIWIAASIVWFANAYWSEDHS